MIQPGTDVLSANAAFGIVLALHPSAVTTPELGTVLSPQPMKARSSIVQTCLYNSQQVLHADAGDVHVRPDSGGYSATQSDLCERASLDEDVGDIDGLSACKAIS